jgi:hypothetical protein
MEEAGRGLRLPGLEFLLGKGSLAAARGETYESWLFGRFGVARRGDWPVAPLTLLADGGEPGQDFWLRADPVLLQAQGGSLVLAEAGALRISAAEAAELAQALNLHFQTAGLEIRPLRPQRWYLRLPEAPAMTTHPPEAAAGRNVDEFLPAGPDALRWHRLLNEVQMLLHQQPVNEAREKRGDRPVTSLWFWGGGRLPQGVNSPFAAVWCDEPLAAGLARSAGLRAQPLPGSASGWLPETAGDEQVLLVLDALRFPARLGDAFGWREAVQAMEKCWFAPLAQALRAKRLARLTLSSPAPERSRELVVNRGEFWKFWRGPRSLS